MPGCEFGVVGWDCVDGDDVVGLEFGAAGKVLADDARVGGWRGKRRWEGGLVSGAGRMEDSGLVPEASI